MGPASLKENVTTGEAAVDVVVAVSGELESGFFEKENDGNVLPSVDGFVVAPPKMDGLAPNVNPLAAVDPEVVDIREAPKNDDFGVFDADTTGEPLAAAAALTPKVNFCASVV